MTDLKVTVHESMDVDEELADTDKVKKEEAQEEQEVILKIPDLTVVYWCEKMTATTFGETFADFFSQTLKLGYTHTSLVLISIFFVSLAGQLKVRQYWPALFWLVMATSSIAGTCVSDFIDRTLHWGYPKGMGVLLSILLAIIGVWKLTGLPMNVAGAMSRKAEFLYWSTILVSNTLGTALGDFFADSLSLGFGISAAIYGASLTICALLAYFTKVSRVALFWFAFVLTRPFGATFGDLLTKKKAKGGLDLGTWRASAVIFALFMVSFAFELYDRRKKRNEKAQAEAEKEISA